MAFTRLAARSNNALESSCKSSALFKWCPIDVVLWLLVLYIVIVLLWRLCCRNRRRKTTTASNSKGYHRLALPYPQPPPEKYEDVSMTEQDSSSSTLVDPFLLTNSFDNSLISQDGSFKRMAMPEPALKRKESVNPSALGLPELIMVAQPPQSRLHDKESTFLPPVSPPPAYVRSPR